MSPLLENETSQVPVTALSLAWPNIIFVGQGPYLKIYKRDTTELLTSRRLLDKQAIHGFALSYDDEDATVVLLAWGGRCICQVAVTREENRKALTGIILGIAQQKPIKVIDWIFDISFRPHIRDASVDAKHAVLVTAHNELLELTLARGDLEQQNSQPSPTVRPLFIGPRCGLYSATLRWLSSTQLLVVSGTAFGEIVVWSLNIVPDDVQAFRHFVFTGHEGSIFGVRVSDELLLGDGSKLRLLASCSDDRTIRIWDISDLTSGVILIQNDKTDQEKDPLRTTGFLNYVSAEAEATSKDLCIASGTGHLSRIWDVRFAIERDSPSDSQYLCSIISAGEDATCQKWHLDHNAEQHSFSLKHVAIHHYHNGKNIWSLASNQSSIDSCVVTGGSDGQVVEHSSMFEQKYGSQSHLSISDWSIDTALAASDLLDQPENDETQTSRPHKSQIRPDSFRSFAPIGNSQLLLTTNEGLVLLATSIPGDQWAWKQVAKFNGLKGYSVSCRVLAEPFEYVFFGDSRGNIYYYHSFFEEVKILCNIDGKITKLMAEILPAQTHEYMSLVVVRQGLHPPVQLRVNLGMGGNLHLSATRIFARWTAESPTITSAVIATHNSSEKGLIIGYRNGAIHSYSRVESSSKREFDFELPESHAKNGVTAMVWMPHKGHQENNWDPSFGWLYSVGWDGTLAVHHFVGHYTNPILVHRLSLSFGPNLEGISIDDYTKDVTVWGFTSKYFVCQNVSANQDIIRIECGGAHRVWNFTPLEASPNGPVRGLFAWIKAMKLNITKVSEASHRVIQSGGHGREIKACAVAPVSIARGLGPLIATGAEDTNIEISYFADWHGSQKELKRVSILRKHVTGVQSLEWSTDGRFLFSSGGREEFFVWQLRPIPAVGIGVVCESRCPLDDLDSELRITDFTVRDAIVGERSNVGDRHWVFLISMLYSDSSIKVWRYTSEDSVVPDREAWSFIASTQYTTACLTTAVYLSKTSTGWPLVTGATDGHLAFWSLTERTKQLACYGLQSLHQSSIKAISTVDLAEASWLIISGGDDNALGLTVLAVDDESGEYTSTSLLVPAAHAATVSAIGVLQKNLRTIQNRDLSLDVVTASNDQVIKLWNIKVDLRKRGVKGISIKKEGTFASVVADVSSLAVFDRKSRYHRRRTKILLCGAGTEIWSDNRQEG